MLSNANTSVELRKFIKEICDRIITDNIPNGASYSTTGTGIPPTISVSSVRNFLQNNGYFVDAAYLYNNQNNLPGFDYTWEALSYGPTYMEGNATQGLHAWVAEGAKIISRHYYEKWTYWYGNKIWEHRIYDLTPILYKYVKCRWGWDNYYPNTTPTINTWFTDNVFMVTRLGETFNFNSSVYVVRKIY